MNPESQIDKSVTKLEAQLELWSTKLKELTAKAGAARDQAKVDSRKQLDELKTKIAAARSKLDEAKAAGSAKWETLKQDVEHTWKDLESAFKKLVH